MVPNLYFFLSQEDVLAAVWSSAHIFTFDAASFSYQYWFKMVHLPRLAIILHWDNKIFNVVVMGYKILHVTCIGWLTIFFTHVEALRNYIMIKMLLSSSLSSIIACNNVLSLSFNKGITSCQSTTKLSLDLYYLNIYVRWCIHLVSPSLRRSWTPSPNNSTQERSTYSRQTWELQVSVDIRFYILLNL